MARSGTAAELQIEPQVPAPDATCCASLLLPVDGSASLQNVQAVYRPRSGMQFHLGAGKIRVGDLLTRTEASDGFGFIPEMRSGCPVTARSSRADSMLAGAVLGGDKGTQAALGYLLPAPAVSPVTAERLLSRPGLPGHVLGQLALRPANDTCICVTGHMEASTGPGQAARRYEAGVHGVRHFRGGLSVSGWAVAGAEETRGWFLCMATRPSTAQSTGWAMGGGEREPRLGWVASLPAAVDLAASHSLAQAGGPA